MTAKARKKALDFRPPRLWEAIVTGTVAYAIILGWALSQYPKNVSTVTWHGQFVGWAGIIGGVFTTIDTIRWQIARRGNPHWWVGFGLIVTATLARTPMAFWRLQKGVLPWGQAVNVMGTTMFLAVVLVILWIRVVVPDADKYMAEAQRDQDVG